MDDRSLLLYHCGETFQNESFSEIQKRTDYHNPDYKNLVAAVAAVEKALT